MRHKSIPLLSIVSIVLVIHQTAGQSSNRHVKRQANPTERESSTASYSQPPPTFSTPYPPRLYPDLPDQPDRFLPPFGGQPYPPNHGPTPFVPFRAQMPPNRLDSPQNRARFAPTTPAERLQSQTFVSGLGRRLLSMVGIEPQSNSTNEAPKNLSSSARSGMDEMVRALHNSTVLQQLNRGVQSIYGNLSKMYNSTVQQQLDMLQARYGKEAENGTNNHGLSPDMSQQMLQFFRTITSKVEIAQANLNRMFQQLSMASNQSNNKTAQSLQSQGGAPMNPMDQFIGENMPRPNNFFNQIGRSLGFNDQEQPRQNDLGNQLMGFWHNHFQPHIGMLRDQVRRIWMDLDLSGALRLNPTPRYTGKPGHSLAENTTSDMVDDLLKGVDISGAEYSLIGAQSNQPTSSQPSNLSNMSSRIQQSLMDMQRDINRVWMGLSNSLQGMLDHARRAVVAADETASTGEQQGGDNDVSSKMGEILKVQKETDAVYDVIRQQQQQAQERQRFGSRFMNFFNNMELGDLDRIPMRLSETVSRFGTAVGDLWNQIPERWDNFVHNRHPLKETGNARISAPAITPTLAPNPS